MLLARPDNELAHKELNRFYSWTFAVVFALVALLTVSVICVITPPGYYPMLKFFAVILAAILIILLLIVVVAYVLLVLPHRQTGEVIRIQVSTRMEFFKTREEMPDDGRRPMGKAFNDTLFHLQEAKNGVAETSAG